MAAMDLVASAENIIVAMCMLTKQDNGNSGLPQLRVA
jgi:acyl CoA:acetate/3-ketoacid CoA transferase beta subunit